MSNAIWKSLSHQADRIAEKALAGVGNRQDWEALRPTRLLELQKSLGLEPWPSEGLPIPVTREYGEFQGLGFRARKIGYELLPDCWGAAALYYPDPLPAGRKLPAVLYSCGHTQIGSSHFQTHPIMWARRGYACLILDSMEQNDNPGEHHGFNLHFHHKRLSLGYTSCGGEVFNVIRALDVLAADSLVDPSRIGLTGVSGGGAMSFFATALDGRIRAVATHCGISSPRDAIANRHIFGHCDCMYPLNIFRRDPADFAALIAPRPALFGFAKQDLLYHLDENLTLIQTIKKVWELLGQSDLIETVIADGPHGDHRDFDEATQRWFDRHLAGEEREILPRGAKEISEKKTCIFNGCPPTPNRLALLPELSRPRRTIPLPQSPEDFVKTRKRVVASLKSILPDESPKFTFTHRQSWDLEKVAISWHQGEIETSEVFLQIRTPSSKTNNLVLCTATGGQILNDVIASVSSSLYERSDTATAVFEPRLSGWNYQGPIPPIFPAGSQMELETRILKAMSIVGSTPVSMFYHDIRCAMAYLSSLAEFQESCLFLYGKGEAAAASLLVALTNDRVDGVILEDLPGSFEDRCAVIGILGILDIPQASGLLAPKPVALITPGEANWCWANRAYDRMDAPLGHFLSPNIQTAFQKILS